MAKMALVRHLVLLVLAILLALITQWQPLWSGIVGMTLAGTVATLQGMALNAYGFSALWWSQGLKWLLLVLGVVGLLNTWTQLYLPGFLVGAAMSQLIWARIGVERAIALRERK